MFNLIKPPNKKCHTFFFIEYSVSIEAGEYRVDLKIFADIQPVKVVSIEKHIFSGEKITFQVMPSFQPNRLQYSPHCHSHLPDHL